MCWLHTWNINCVKRSIIALLQKVSVFIKCHSDISFRL
jgi:hypothetical protein